MSESEGNDKKWPARATTKLMTALNRADELGGELRDYLLERRDQLSSKISSDPRYSSARTTLARWLGRGRSAPSRPPAAPAAPAAPVPAAAAAPAAPPAKPATRKGLGDPAIKAQIFGKRSCPWSGRAISLLERRKVDFDFVDLEEPEHEAKLVPLTQETRQHTVPYVYLRGKFVGGFNALSEIERLGQLDTALMSQDELAAAPAHVRAVEIVPRPNTDEVAPAEAGAAPDSAG
jgi:glutaredoxin